MSARDSTDDEEDSGSMRPAVGAWRAVRGAVYQPRRKSRTRGLAKYLYQPEQYWPDWGL